MAALNIKNKNQHEADSFKLGNELIGLLSIFIGLLFILSLATFDLRDPWVNHVVSGNASIHNKVGLLGAHAGGFLLDLCGLGAWLVPALFCFIGARKILDVPAWPWWRWTGIGLLFIVFSFVGASRDLSQAQAVLEQGQGLVANHGGGLIGHLIYESLIEWLNPTGAWLIWTLCFLFSIQVMVGFSWLVVVAQFARFLIQTSTKMAEDIIHEHQHKKGKDIIALENDGTNTSHFSLPSSLFGKKALVSSSNEAETLLLDNAATASSSTNPPWDEGKNHNEGQSTFSENQHFSFEVAPEEPEAEKKSFFKSLFPQPKKSTSEDSLNLPYTSDSLDLPPWVDDFEHEPVEQGADASLRPDFSAVKPSVQGEGKEPAEQDALLSILENYESSIQEQESSLSDTLSQTLPNSTDVFTTEAAAPTSSLNRHETDGIKSHHTLVKEHNDGVEDISHGSNVSPATPAGADAGTNQADNKQDEPHEAAPQHLSGSGAGAEAQGAIPIREKALDSVMEAVSPDEEKTPVVRKKARLPLPPLELLEAVGQSGSKTPYAVLESKAHDLMTCLSDFGIQGELVGITPGPVVTMFEVRPAPGVRVARIANLSDDLALALKAVAVRIQAPVPGTDTVGVEIPNEQREVVCLRQILSSDTFSKSQSFLSIALGKDIAGHPTVADLATMPHLLVAGATGAGKSVGINSIILSLLYKATPDEVRLLLVDPKRVEMAIYADLPHLVHPVVTEMQLAKNALDWAVREMDDRYTILAKAQVRNITDYNLKVKEHAQKPIPEMEGLEHMPYLVIIIDELADLMLTAAKEVETSIVRLAQLARAAGIHLILATQRPSVDVVTGIIKANFPCRIAFQVTSKHDSRTILDSVGAEHLLGKGDMLFKPSGGRFQRMHGAFVTDKNVKKVVDYWKRLQKPKFDIDFSEFAAAAGEATGNGQSDIYDDPVYNEAVDFVCEQGKASISLIQRRFRIGFNKAARIIEQMEVDGIVGPQEGSKPRTVLR